MTKAILVIQKLLPEQIEDLKKKAPDYKIIQDIQEAKPEEVEIILGWSNELLPLVEDEKSNVKWVQFAYAGVNHLPLDLFVEKEILLTNGSGIHAHSVSETALGLLLGMTRHIVPAAINQKKEIWDGPANLYELSGKTMLIVGIGRIGVQLAKVAQALNMKTIGINRSGRKAEFMDEQYLQSELADVLHKADVVVNILPLTKETKHLYDQALFNKMKDGVIFINVGRGESVKTEDLLVALDNEKIKFAGLDVFEQEPLPKEHPLWQREDVIMTPHIGGNLENYPKHIYPLFLENFLAFSNNEEIPRNLVELANGY